MRRTLLFVAVFMLSLGAALYTEFYTILFAWVRAGSYLASPIDQQFATRSFLLWAGGFLTSIACLIGALMWLARGIAFPRGVRPLLWVMPVVLVLVFGYRRPADWLEIDGHMAHFASEDHGWGEPIAINALKPNERIVVDRIWTDCIGPGDGQQFEFSRWSDAIRFSAHEGIVIRSPKYQPWLQPILVLFPKIIRGEISDYKALEPGAEVGSLSLSLQDLNGLEHTLTILRRHERRFATGYATYRFTYWRAGMQVGEERFIVPRRLDDVTDFANEGLLHNPDFAADRETLATELRISVPVLQQIVTLEMLDRRLRPQDDSPDRSMPPAS